jgi:hypothetical protein
VPRVAGLVLVRGKNAHDECWEEWRKHLERNAAMIADIEIARTEIAATFACYGATTLRLQGLLFVTKHSRCADK